jgi:hypothetical protein
MVDFENQPLVSNHPLRHFARNLRSEKIAQQEINCDH